MSASTSPSAAGSDAPPSSPEPALPRRTSAVPTAPLVNWWVLIVTGLVVIAVSVWAMIDPVQAETAIGSVVGWVATNLGWFYVLTSTVVIVFVLIVAFGRAGNTKMGPDHSSPHFSLFTWTAMLFAAGIGIDLMFFSVAEPVSQYYAPPSGEGQTLEATRQAVVWTLFHYGITGWAMYALMGMAFGYFAFRHGLPLSIRSALYPLIGRRVYGRAGDAVDIAALLGTIFGVATSLGIGVAQLNYGLYLMFGIPESTAAQAALIAVAVIMATISCVSGVDKGIRRLSELNVILAIALLLYILVTGQTAFILDALVNNLGDFVASFGGMTLNTFAYEDAGDWMAGWTLFFWAWWIAWAPFVGLFLARISRGRTLREFVVATMTVPFAFILIMISVFGNSALAIVTGGNDAFGEVAMNQPERAFYSLLEQFPAAPAVIAVATVTGMLFYVTSADSGALVMSNFTSTIADPRQDGPTWLRIFWSVATGVLTLAMLIVGGITTLQNATLIIGLPFAVVMYLIMISLWKALRVEISQSRSSDTSRASAVAGRSGRGTEGHWRRRLRRATSYPSPAQATRYLDQVAEPALLEIQREIRSEGGLATVERLPVEAAGTDSLTLRVDMAPERDFMYQLYPVAAPIPSFGRPDSRPTQDAYVRLEVFSHTGSHEYDILDYSRDQIIDDVLDHYERHLEFLRLSSSQGSATQLSLDPRALPTWESEDFDTSLNTGVIPTVATDAQPKPETSSNRKDRTHE
ncbi:MULTISPECIES: choline BCCT transporter BetT [Kocuria]|uniref:Choline BCCT transporter BetT n=1 Tax=Kocuria subflava TaxID=1736139 RepID=A0A846TTD1_9MICC|nr:choline BCCT transporter BetT [Kocuria sp. CPCC 104605]NKE09044.1 choline BCCT transporter BetT [Kocuria subflava]